MPTKRFRVVRNVHEDLTPGQRMVLQGVFDPDAAELDIMSYNQVCWLSPPWVYGGPDKPCPDGSPGAAELWRRYGLIAFAEWRETHSDEPHPLLEHLGEPGAGT